MGTKAERRRNLVLKWYHLDNIKNIEELRERLEQHGYMKVSASTIRNYLHYDEMGEETMEKVRERHADARLQIAEKLDSKHDRARASEEQATRDVPIKAVVPATTKADGRRNQVTVPYGWERIEPGESDYPSWAEDRDTPIRILPEEETRVEGGEHYPVTDPFNQPKYTTQMVGIERDVEDHKSRSFLRQEQTDHLETKADVLGVTEDKIELGGSVSIEHDIDVPDEIVEAIQQAAEHRLANPEEGEDD